jgi:hypothetical protein
MWIQTSGPGARNHPTAFVLSKNQVYFISIKSPPDYLGNVDRGFCSISSTPQDGARQARVKHSHARCRGSVRDRAFGAQR